MKTSKKQSPYLSEINVTPMVDIMLVLLIIFMVAAPMLKQQVKLQLPQVDTEHNAQLKEQDLNLSVTKNKKIYIANQEVLISKLQSVLASIYKNKKNKDIYLFADQSLDYGFVLNIMSIAKKAGVDKIGMISDPKNYSK